MTLDIGPRCISSALWTFAFPFPSRVVSFPSLFQPSSYCTGYLIRICSLYSFIQYSGLYILSFILVFALIVFPQKIKKKEKRERHKRKTSTNVHLQNDCCNALQYFRPKPSSPYFLSCKNGGRSSLCAHHPWRVVGP